MGFILNSIDMGLTLCTVVMVTLRVILEVKIRKRLSKIVVAEIVVGLACLGQILYESAVASDFEEFLEAETLALDILRTSKCLRVFLLFC